MKTYKIEATAAQVPDAIGGTYFGRKWTVAFGAPATNQEIVREVNEYLNGEGKPVGGKLLLINGPASLPVAFALAHAVNHLFGVVAVFDPKLAGYVVAVSHDPAFVVGALIQEN